MADDWSAFNPQPADGTGKPIAQNDEWAAFNPQPAPEAKAAAEEDPELHRAFNERVSLGDRLKNIVNTLAKAPEVPEYEPSHATEKLLGLNGVPRFQTWPERMIRSGFTLAKDVMDGTVVTGPGLRREDILALQGLPDDPSIPEPLDMLIERAQDMAGFQLAQTSVAHPVRPLLRSEDGRVVRTQNDGSGGASGQIVGEPPKPQDFQTSAELLGEERAAPRLEELYKERGIHPAEAVADAQADPFLKHELTAPAKDAGEIILPTGAPRPLGAEVTSLPPIDIPLSAAPASPSGRMIAAATRAAQTVLDLGRDLQMQITPMARGTDAAIATAKDFANTLRRNRWDWSRIDEHLQKKFTPEQRERMWNAADEESVMQQRGEKSEHMGLATLEPHERAAIDELTQRSHDAWTRAYDVGLVRNEEGLPVYTPRMVIDTAGAGAEGIQISINSMGKNLRVATKQMIKREYMTAEETEAAARRAFGPQAKIARDIRALPLATARLEDAIAGRQLINQIKDYGKNTLTDTVVEGWNPGQQYFTMDHPAFQTRRPIIGIKDPAGNPVFENVPIYIHKDYEGPLRAILTQSSGPIYRALMAIKEKAMSLIMNSPVIHNAVEFGRAFPAMPVRIWTAYAKGNRAKHNVELMHEAIDNGLVPIGKRFFKQDINSIMEAPDLTPGQSWTAKLLGAVPDLFSPAAGDAVKRAVDRAGNFWHNTLLWDRIADLQMGLYVNLKDDLLRKGVDPQTSSRVAAHFANRYAGSLPKEAMSDAATKFSNFLMFSRTFTIGNLGVMKDAVTGLPKDVMAQIMRDAGEINPEAAGYAKAMARRKAMMVIAADVALMYGVNSVLQSAFNVMLGDRTMSEEMHGYTRRFKEVMNEVKTHPMSLLQPMDIAEKLTPMSENEPGKKERIKIGYTQDGTAIYMRQPFGKIGEEFMGYMFRPIDMMKAKMGTMARPFLQVISNDKGFGRKIYDPEAEMPAERAATVWAIVKHFMAAQTPEGQIGAVRDLIKGDGDAGLNWLQALGPVSGFTFSKGAPGGPAMGELYHARNRYQFRLDQELPDLRKQIQRGDIVGARQRMTELGVPAGLQNFYVRTSLNPATRLRGRTLRDFYNYSTPEQRERFEQQRSGWSGE